MENNFVTQPEQIAVNLNYVTKIQHIGAVEASMLGEFIIKNHSDGKAYIKFSIADNDDIFWAFPSEDVSKTEYQKLMQKISM